MIHDATGDAGPPVRILRVITRLNVGGPAIQAIELSTRLNARGYRTRMVFGRLGEREGDMRYLLPPAADASQVDALRRPIAPLSDLHAVARLLAIMREFRPHIV